MSGESTWPAVSAEARERGRRAKLTPAQRAFEDEYGREAAERQADLARTFWPCCGETREHGHRFACSNYKPPADTEIHPDQESLL